MTLPLPLRTERLLLRLLQPSDLTRFAAYRADPELARFQGWSPMSETEAMAFIESTMMPPTLGTGQWHQLAIADGDDDALLGDIGLCVRADGEAELGFTLMREAQGRGLATEALRGLVDALFRHAAVTRVVGVTDERNLASVRVLERLGMDLLSREATVFKQEPCVELRYELTRAPAGALNRR